MKHLTLIDKAFILKSSPLFSNLGLDLLLPIADKLSVLTHNSGDIVFSIGEEAQRMYFAAKGMLTLQGADGECVAHVEHDFFGDEALFSELPRSYTAICESKVVLLALSRTNLLSIISECPVVAMALLHTYACAIPCRPR